MSRALLLPRSFTLLVAVLVAAFAVLLAPVSLLPAAGVTEDGATRTAAPADDGASSTAEPGAEEETPTVDDPAVTEEPAADDPAGTDGSGEAAGPVPPAESFEVRPYAFDCGSYGVEVSYDGDVSTLRLAVQEEVDGAWTTLWEPAFDEGWADIYVEVEEGETAVLRVVAYDVAAPEQLTVVDGPTTVAGVASGECEEPTLPEDQWTLAEAGCGPVTFTSRAGERVAVVWLPVADVETEPTFFFLEPGQSRTFETAEELIFWDSAVGIDDDFIATDEDYALAGGGELEIPQDCPAPAPAQPGGGHQIPGKVQTDGGASTAPAALGVALMGLAGAALVRRRA